MTTPRTPLIIPASSYAARARLFSEETTEGRFESLKEICCYNRINSLACIVAAGRGWLGASFSCAEILASIYFDKLLFDTSRGDVVALSKGHAAVMQYSCLVGVNILAEAELLRYEFPDGPQAHTDRQTAGIDINTGSLGQTLSKCLGLSLARPQARVYVVLGDGELQEGQNWEAFMSWSKFGLKNLVAIVDCNGIQTDSDVCDIMPIPELQGAMAAFGITVLHVADGNDCQQMHAALLKAHGLAAPVVILAQTLKGAGLSFTAARTAAPRSYSWHGGVPSVPQYLDALRELSRGVGDEAVKSSILHYCDATTMTPPPVVTLPQVLPLSTSPAATPEAISTGMAFGAALVTLGKANAALRVLDADLEKSCQLTAFALQLPGQFLEVGVAEQNMVSLAGGLALGGLLPVVNTYANFYRRAAEQVYVNATEHARIVYAGHYAGLCYATDGKTHQATGDLALFRSIPGIAVVYPAWPEEAAQVLQWYASLPCSLASPLPSSSCGATPSTTQGPTSPPATPQQGLYLRLHRTPALFGGLPPAPASFVYGHGAWVRACPGSSHVVVTAGPHMVASCLAACLALAPHAIDVVALSSHSYLAPDFLARLQCYPRVAVVEEAYVCGGLWEAVVAGLNPSVTTTSSSSQGAHQTDTTSDTVSDTETTHGVIKATPPPALVPHLAPKGLTFSTRERTGLYAHFGLTPPQVAQWLRQQWQLS